MALGNSGPLNWFLVHIEPGIQVRKGEVSPKLCFDLHTGGNNSEFGGLAHMKHGIDTTCNHHQAAMGGEIEIGNGASSHGGQFM